LRDFDEGIVCARVIEGTSLGELREAVAPVLARCLDRDASLSSCAFMVAMPSGAELCEGMGGGRDL